MISVKTTKYLFKNPIQLITNSLSDYKKDNSKNKLVFNKVWCIGLPKSGTTLIENILEELPYVEMFSSVFRKWENTDPNICLILMYLKNYFTICQMRKILILKHIRNTLS